MGVTYDGPDYSEEKIEVVFRPSLLYPSGRVFLFDDFESATLKWSIGGNPAGYVGEHTTASAFGGNASLGLTTDDTADARVDAARYVGLPPSKEIGMELRFFKPAANLKWLNFGMIVHDGTNEYEADIRFDDVNDIWQYRKTDEGYKDIPNSEMNLYAFTDSYHFFKWSANFATGKYIALFIDDKFLDLSAYSMKKTGDTGARRVKIEINAYTAADAAVTTYIDDFALVEED